MMGMRSALSAALLAALVCLPVAAQDLAVLHIRVVLPDAQQQPLPVPRHVLLISDNPASTAPRRVVTRADGTIDVRLRPGNYTVESEAPTTVLGQGYEWTQTLDVRGETTLELGASNAAHVAAPAVATPGSAAAGRSDPAVILPLWQTSVVAVWTPTAHATGVVVDAAGLIATNQRVVGAATRVEVQLGPAQKVAGVVVAADATRDVALIRVDPSVLGPRRPVLPGCPPATPVAVRREQDVVALEWPMHERAGMAEGQVLRVDARALIIDAHLDDSGSGGPVFSGEGAFLGLTASATDDDRRAREARVIRAGELCAVLAAAASTTSTASATNAAVSAALLPLEPTRPFPAGALEDMVSKRAGNLNPYPLTSRDFTIGVITPVMLQWARQAPRVPPPLDFGAWHDYFAEVPPVLVLRVTPKMVEGALLKAARGAAMTQGVALPPLKRPGPNFLRLQAFCGDTEVTPIHPFTLATPVGEKTTMTEGLYVFDPDALGPQCGTARLVLYTEKTPDKGDPLAIDATTLQKAWQDFAPYRGQ